MNRPTGPSKGLLRFTWLVPVLWLAAVSTPVARADSTDVPRRGSGRAEPGSLRWGLYDDFDGAGAEQPDGSGQLAVAGTLSQQLWAGAGEVIWAGTAVPNPAGRGRALRLALDDTINHVEAWLRNPVSTALCETNSLRGAFSIPATATSRDFRAALNISAEVLGVDDPWWTVSLDIGPRSWQQPGEVWINACWEPVGTDTYECEGMAGRADHWYLLRIDLRPLLSGGLRVRFLVDDTVLADREITGGATLLEPGRLAWGPRRQVSLWRDDPGSAAVVVDAVEAAYAVIQPNDTALYDDFDGNGNYRAADDSHLAIAGALSPALWNGSGTVHSADEYVTDPGSHGRVLVLRATPAGADWIELTNPVLVDLTQAQSLSADLLIPSAGHTRSFNASLQVAAGLAGPPESYWDVATSIGVDDSGALRIGGCCRAAGSDQPQCGSYPARPDTWYTLRLDLAHDPEGLHAQLLVDDLPLLTCDPDPDGVLSEPAAFDWGPVRRITQWTAGDGEGTVLVDSVRADFRRITLDRVEPTTFPVGQPTRVRLYGSDFGPDSIPLSTPWGLEFTDVTRLDGQTITAAAVARSQAGVGTLEVVVAGNGADASNRVPVAVIPGTEPASSSLAFGLYDDFDGHGAAFGDDSPLAVRGLPSADLWSGSGEVDLATSVAPEDDGHGDVLVLTTVDADTGGDMVLLDPLLDPLGTIGSLSAAVFLPSAHPPGGAGIEVQGTFCELADEVFNARLVLRDDGDRGWLDACVTLPGIADADCCSRPAAPDTWHQLRIDIAPSAADKLEITILADETPLLRSVADDGQLLTDPRRSCWGPRRALFVWPSADGSPSAAAFDDVHAVFEPRVPEAAPVYDDFDGHGGEQPSGDQLAVAGHTAAALWHLHRGTVVLTPSHLPEATEHGYAVRFEDAGQDCLNLQNPPTMPFEKWRSLSFDLLASSEVAPGDGAFNLELHTGFPETPPGKSYYLVFGMRYQPDRLFTYLYYKNINTTSTHWLDLGLLEFDTWYRFRLDFVPVSYDTLRMDAYVDGVRRHSEYLSDGGLMLHPSNLLDPRRVGDNFPRFFSGSGPTVYYLDNVRAPYTGAPATPAGGGR